MKTERSTTWTATLAGPIILIASLSGCGMTDSKTPSPVGPGNDNAPYAGTKPQEDVNRKTKEVSSEILDLLTVKGEVSEPGPGVTECGGKDRDKYFRILHSWSLTPPSAGQAKLGKAFENLKEALPDRGWEIKQSGRDSSRNKNLGFVADNEKRKFSIEVVHYAKDSPPMLGVRVISACYQVPEGDQVEHY